MKLNIFKNTKLQVSYKVSAQTLKVPAAVYRKVKYRVRMGVETGYCEGSFKRWWTKHWPPVYGLPLRITLKWTMPVKFSDYRVRKLSETGSI